MNRKQKTRMKQFKLKEGKTRMKQFKLKEGKVDRYSSIVRPNIVTSVKSPASLEIP